MFREGTQLMNLTGTALRAVIAYTFLLLLVRLAGKRTIRQGTAMDFVTALILGELVDKLLTGKVPFLQYATASITVLAVHVLVNVLCARSNFANGWLVGREEAVVERGARAHRGMCRERMSARTLASALRGRGIRDIREIKAADIEIDGAVSTLKEDWAAAAQKQDADRVRRRRPGG